MQKKIISMKIYAMIKMIIRSVSHAICLNKIELLW